MGEWDRPRLQTALLLLKHVPSMWAFSLRYDCWVTLFHLCTSDQTQNWKCCHGNQEQSRRRLHKDYGYIFYFFFLFLLFPLGTIPAVCTSLISCRARGTWYCKTGHLTPDELNTSLSYSYLRQTRYSLTDLFRTNPLLTISLVQAVLVFSWMINTRCKIITLQPINTFKWETDP